MRLVFHPKVYSDIAQVMEYYEQVASADLADEFYAELRQLMREAAKRPESFPIRERDIRRANLRRFPYHFLFRMTSDAVRILVVRHHKREPSLGTGRR
jgi:plasmid stabilization system protein ParE